MGMVVSLVSITEERLQRFMNDSSLLEDYLFEEEHPDDGTDGYDECYIDKAWSGIEYLMTGKGMEGLGNQNCILFSGQLIDEDQDMGYGPAHYWNNEQVKNINTRIAAISQEQLKAKYNPSEMNSLDIYPNIWGEGDEAFEYLSEHYQEVKYFYKRAAEKTKSVIVYIS